MRFFLSISAYRYVDSLRTVGVNTLLGTFAQDFVREGAQCWVLHPHNGTKPVAEGIAGGAPSRHSIGDGSGSSFLEDLCNEGQQMVKVTKVYKKNTELMYVENRQCAKFLDEYVTPTAPMVNWAARYLAEKEDDG